MEILIPSLAMILAAVAVAFFVLPKVAPIILTSASAVVLAIAIYVHYNRFGTMEYERSTWQNNLKGYTSYVIVGMIIVGAYGYYAMNSGNGSSMPALTTPTIGGGFDTVIKTAVTRVNQLMRKGRISE